MTIASAACHISSEACWLSGSRTSHPPGSGTGASKAPLTVMALLTISRPTTGHPSGPPGGSAALVAPGRPEKGAVVGVDGPIGELGQSPVGPGARRIGATVGTGSFVR